MKNYLGTKAILATPMNRADYNTYRGWKLPAEEDGTDSGFLVEYTDGGKANHREHTGYISWSPADVFNKAYHETEGLSFGLAIEAAKMGNRIARASWNGKNMFVVYISALYLEAEKVNERTSRWIGEGVDLDCQPYFAMYNAQQKWQPGWTSTQSDMLAEDWFIVE